MAEQALKPVTAHHAGRILVADDDEGVRLLLRELLEEDGHQVILAEDGVEALQKALTEHPDAVLLDVMMPNMEGFEVCRRLREEPRTAHLPILIVTSLTQESDRLRAFEAGANDVVTKPVDNDEMRLRVRNAVYQQHLYTELQKRYRELKAQTELRESLTRMIEAETETLSSLMQGTTQTEDGGHGAG